MTSITPAESKIIVGSTAVLETFTDDVGSLWSGTTIPTLTEPPTGLRFLREFVSKSKPCIVRRAIPDAGETGDLRLSLDGIIALLDDDDDTKQHVMLTVDVTPDGHGDVVRSVCDSTMDDSSSQMFVKPHSTTMGLEEFRSRLRRCETVSSAPRSIFNKSVPVLSESMSHHPDPIGDDVLFDDDDEVVYYSQQNDCLRTELKLLFNRELIPPTFPWAEEAFGTGPPDAINLWMGNQRAVSSMHKDHYENLFYVLSGEKVFTICPPADAPFLYENDFPSGQFVKTMKDKSPWAVRRDEGDTTVKWIEADVEPLIQNGSDASLERFPLLRHTHPIQIRVRAGEMLYLPSLWFHKVTQSCETVGVNYWYDMHFDSPLWCYFNLLQQMKAEARHPG